MRARFLLPCLALAVATCATADPQPAPAPSPTPAVPLDLGPPITVDVGRKCILTAETTAKKVTWRIPAGCDTLALDGKRLAVWALPGTYTFTAMVPSGDDVTTAEIVLTVTGARPPPPEDKLQEQIQKAFDSEPTSVRLPDGTVRTKALDAVALAEAYRAHAKALPGFATANDAANDLLAVRKAAVADRIPSVRLIAGKELAKIMPSIAATPLTDAQKAAATAFLNRFAGLLDQVK